MLRRAYSAENSIEYNLKYYIETSAAVIHVEHIDANMQQ